MTEKASTLFLPQFEILSAPLKMFRRIRILFGRDNSLKMCLKSVSKKGNLYISKGICIASLEPLLGEFVKTQRGEFCKQRTRIRSPKG